MNDNEIPADCSTFNSINDNVNRETIPLSLTRSSYYPDTRHRSDIQGVLNTSEQKIHDLESTICNLQSQLLHVRKVSAFHSSLLAPIRRVHDELLSEIFSYVCEEAINIGTGSGPIWDLRQVCARWRILVDGTPSMWNRFKVKKIELNSTMITHRVKLCLEKSRQSLLSVSLLPHHTRKLPLEAFEHVMRHSDRFLTLHICAKLAETAPESVQRLTQQSGLSQLRWLSLLGYKLKWSTIPRFQLFRTADGLEHVTLICVALPNVLNLSLNKVKRIKISYCSGGPQGALILSILQNTPNLEELHWFSTDVDSVSRSGGINLPSLHTFNVSRPDGTSNIWSALFMPTLKNLRIQNIDHNDAEFLLPMIQRWASLVKSLRIDGCSKSVINQITCQPFPEVTELVLYLIDLVDLTEIMYWVCPATGVIYHRFPSLNQITIQISINCHSMDPDIIPSLKLVMQHRARSANSMQDGHKPTALAPSPLASIHYHGSTSQISARKYFSALREVRELGSNLGIEVETQLGTLELVEGKTDRCITVILNEEDYIGDEQEEDVTLETPDIDVLDVLTADQELVEDSDSEDVSEAYESPDDFLSESDH